VRPFLPDVLIADSQIFSAKTLELKSLLACTIARALAVFCVDEVVIFDDEPNDGRVREHDAQEYTADIDPSHFLAHVLSYLETPPFLRKSLFPFHKNLRLQGIFSSLDMPHHAQNLTSCPYKEGVTVSSSSSSASPTTIVNIGSSKNVTLPGVEIPPQTRVTLRLDPDDPTEAEAVGPSTPREEGGYYWGYTVRRCPSLSSVFTECMFDGGYDVSFGLSERGHSVSELDVRNVPPPQHALIVLGGVAGLEVAADADPELKAKGIGKRNVGDLFDHWVNILPGQGSRTIRTEEAIWIGLTTLREIRPR